MEQDPTEETMFTEPGGKPSNMRLLAFLSVLFAGLLALNDAGLAWLSKDGLGIQYIIPFLTAAFGGKFAQRFVEYRKVK